VITRRLLVMADERLTDTAANDEVDCWPRGEPRGHVADAWQAKEAVRGGNDGLIWPQLEPCADLTWLHLQAALGR
jgi:hypothetical protein